MKKVLNIILLAFALSVMAYASAPELDNDISTAGASPTVAAKSFDTSDVSPAINILTKTKDAYTFNSADFGDYFYNGDSSTATQYVYTTATDQNKGKVFAVVLNTEEYDKKHETNTSYVYSSLAAGFTEKLDRPVHLYFETYGTKQIGFWLSAGSTHRNFGQLGIAEWKSVSINNAPVFNGTMKYLWLQYATRPSDCSQIQFYDNVAVFPFYKITYNAEYPDGTSGEATVKYYFDASSLTVADDGTVSGLPSSYTVETVKKTCPGYKLAGWSTEKNASAPLTQVPLNGEDIELYPVWTEAESLTIPEEYLVPGVNVFTGTAKALNFDSPVMRKFFKFQETELFTLDVVNDPISSGKGNMMRVTLDTEKYLAKYTEATYTYYMLESAFESALTRPGVLLYDTYGRGTVGFWLSAGTTHRNLGTLPSAASWFHVAQNNASIFNGSLEKLRIQYGINGKNCDNIQYFDNIAFIPYYKATYIINYPNGTSTDSCEKYFLCNNSAITVSNDGTLSGLPEVYVPENIGISFPGYDLTGWTTVENGDAAMTNIPLENHDIILYPVWKKKAEQIPVTLTLYLDENKTVSTTHSLFAGDAFTFPTYYDLTEYTPDGKHAMGFLMDGTLYAPGKTIYIPEKNAIYAEVRYGDSVHPEYGDLVFLENFDSINAGTYICNPDTGLSAKLPISYISPGYSNNTSHFDIGQADTTSYIYVTDDGTGNNVLKIRKLNATQTWPQIGIYNESTTPKEGCYTICMDYFFPRSHYFAINNINIRTFTTTARYAEISAESGVTGANTWGRLSMSMTIEADSADAALHKFQVYISSKNTSEDAYFYIDNIALYLKDKNMNIRLGEDNVRKVFFVPGSVITMPYPYEVYRSVPEGCTLKGYKYGDKLYMPGESYTTTEESNGITLEAVYEKTAYKLIFNADGGCGSPADITVTDGDAVTLPESGVYHPSATLCGWKACGSDTVYKPGDSYIFSETDEKANLDGTNRLVFTAVYDNAASSNVSFAYNYALSDGMFAGASENELAYIRLAYGAGIIPAQSRFDGGSTVSLSQLLGVAERLHYRSQGVAADFLNDEERLEVLVSKGICNAYTNLAANATYADAAKLLANVLPHAFYPEIAFHVTVTGLDESDEGYTEALKLIRAGIFPESTDFAENITYTDLVSAIAKTVQPSVREVENKRTLYILGDSLTAKTGTIGWPTKLAPYLDGNVEIVNNGIGGIDTSTYFSQYSSTGAYARYINSLIHMKPGDYVVIALGTNDSTLWGRGTMKYETSRDNYYRYICEIRAQGGIPILVCPVGRNNTDKNGVYVESDPLIIQCMNEVNELYGTDATIINFKDISFDRLGAMTANERLEIYADNVHYTSNGADVVAGWFGELVSASSDEQLTGLANHFQKFSFDFDSTDSIYEYSVPVTEFVTSIRASAPAGIRFRAYIDSSVRSITDDVAEYGFIVARKDVLGDKELTHEVDVPYVTGVAYNNVNQIDLIYDINVQNGSITFTGVLTNAPETKQGFTTEFAVRSYVRIGYSFFYGETHYDSIYRAAKRLAGTDRESEYVKNLIAICEG